MGDTSDASAAPYAGFEGSIGRTRAVSEPWWPEPARPPRGAPNVVVMLMDDLGFADFGCFGAEYDTPEIDRLAERGLRFTNFHVTPLCSPSRAALLTGLNHHMAGIGQVIEGTGDTGFPGYRGELAPDALTMAEVFKANGYTTMAVGKWHVTNEMTEGGTRAGWPLQKGFDRYYGFISQTDFWNPTLVDDNHVLDIEQYPEGYYLTDDLTDHAIEMIQSARAANPERPFMMYFAHAAMHSPLHAKPSDIAKYERMYDVGWDEIRERRFRRQQELGVIPEGTTLPPRNTEPGHAVRPWDEHTERERDLLARYMAIYAAMIDNVDQNLARLRHSLEELGEWDNTIVMLMSDNGASRTSGELGTSNFYRTVTQTLPGAGSFADDFELDFSFLDQMGGPRTYPGYPHGWAMASNTPFRLYKMNTHAGGHHVPLVVSWPKGIPESQGTCRGQYTHIIDILPTLIDALGLHVPELRNGLAAKKFQGTSFANALADDTSVSLHSRQYYEMWGNRGFYEDGEEIVTLHQRRTPFADDRWEMYDLRADISETRDLAAERSERVQDLVQLWEEAAWANQVFPLDERIGLNQVRPHWESEPDQVLLLPSMPRFLGASRLVSRRSFRIDLELDSRPDDAGVLVSYGSQASGWVVYVMAGEIRVDYNFYARMLGFSGGPITPGSHLVQFNAVAREDGLIDLHILLDGAETGIGSQYPMLSGQGGITGLDIGLNRRSPVSWALHEMHGTFRYTGRIRRATLLPGEPAADRGHAYYEALRVEALSLQ